MEPKATPKYLSLRDLSKHSSLSVKTLRHFLSDPASPLPHYRMPRKILVHVEEFDAWMARFKATGQAVDLDAVVNEAVGGVLSRPT